MSERHHLSEKDTEARTAKCSVCGDVKIYRAGRGWTCAVRQAERCRAYDLAHPVQAKARRAKPGQHKLLSRDGYRGECIICGPVDAVPWGRGFSCAVRAGQLRTRQQDAPQVRCDVCAVMGDTVWLAPGTDCPRCAQALSGPMPGGRYGAALSELGVIDGYHVGELPLRSDVENAVLGWHTLGEGADEAARWLAANTQLLEVS